MSRPNALPARGARVRGALAVLEQLEAEGQKVWAEDATLRIHPATDIQAGDLAIIKDLKPEILSLLAFTKDQRAILARYGDVDLEDLRRYRTGLEVWLRFSPQEQARMLGYPWTPEDLVNLATVKAMSHGEVIEAGPKLSPLRASPPFQESPSSGLGAQCQRSHHGGGEGAA